VLTEVVPAGLGALTEVEQRLVAAIKRAVGKKQAFDSAARRQLLLRRRQSYT